MKLATCFRLHLHPDLERSRFGVRQLDDFRKCFKLDRPIETTTTQELGPRLHTAEEIIEGELQRLIAQVIAMKLEFLHKERVFSKINHVHNKPVSLVRYLEPAGVLAVLRYLTKTDFNPANGKAIPNQENETAQAKGKGEDANNAADNTPFNFHLNFNSIKNPGVLNVNC